MHIIRSFISSICQKSMDFLTYSIFVKFRICFVHLTSLNSFHARFFLSLRIFVTYSIGMHIIRIFISFTFSQKRLLLNIFVNLIIHIIFVCLLQTIMNHSILYYRVYIPHIVFCLTPLPAKTFYQFLSPRNEVAKGYSNATVCPSFRTSVCPSFLL